jgi:hypothetical protein
MASRSEDASYFWDSPEYYFLLLVSGCTGGFPEIVGWIWEMIKGCSKAPGVSNASIFGS